MRTRNQVADEILVLSAQASSAEAFDRLAGRWHSQLLRFARRLTGDAEGAREVVQEAWVAIARGLGRLEDPATFGPWALKITRRRCADWISQRQRTRRRTVALDAAAGAAAEPDVRTNDLAVVRDALCRLDPDRRALLALFYIEGLTVAEIATVLDIPDGTVKSRLYHARARLREALEVFHETETENGP